MTLVGTGDDAFVIKPSPGKVAPLDCNTIFWNTLKKYKKNKLRSLMKEKDDDDANVLYLNSYMLLCLLQDHFLFWFHLPTMVDVD